MCAFGEGAGGWGPPLIFRMMKPLRTRIAPTPSGYLHVGNAVNFMITWLKARQSGAEILLRIDDADTDRVRPEYVQDIFDVVHWLGISWDIGPQTPSGLYSEWSQTHRTHRYQQVLGMLRDSGALFACSCTRSQIRQHDAAMRYTGECVGKGLSFEAPNVVWRLRTPHTMNLRYPVVRQRNGSPAYNLITVVDDVDYNITNIVRGADLEDATAVQRYLAERLPCLSPFTDITIEHHSLILDTEGAKLSKTAGSSPIDRNQATLERVVSCARERAGEAWIASGR